MAPIPQLPEEIFSSLPLVAQIYIRTLEERIRVLETQVQQQQIQIKQLEERVHHLESQLAKIWLPSDSRRRSNFLPN